MSVTQLKQSELTRACQCISHLVLVATPLFFSIGCHSSLFHDSFDVISASTAEQRSQARASRLINQGLKQFESGKLSKAEASFRKALDTAPGLAAGHNNLGNLYLARHELYQAAWEFERASILAPDQPDPLINLGLVFEQADQLDLASDYYTQALELNPNHPIALGNYVRVLVKTDADPLEINQLLQRLKFVDSRPDWLDWADELLSTKYRFPNFSIRDSDENRLKKSSNPTNRISPSSPPVTLENIEVVKPGLNSDLLPAPKSHPDASLPSDPVVDFSDQLRIPNQ
ncbi:MAG: tetratricopeptide repeat protein [Pirellula sp.]|jgi:Tfp pilus assembly protein PilF|nr:tetratricopeptide repeat protein [Pirellula sp.]